MARAYATDADLTGLDPSNTTPSGTRDVYRSLAQSLISLDVWGEQASMAHALLTLHMLASAGIAGTSSGSSAVTSRTIGSLSVSYNVAPNPTGEHASTGWGVLYDELFAGLPLLGTTGRSEGQLMLGLTSRPRVR